MALPVNVGIKAIEIYFPAQCVDQEELERYDGVSKGKYTVGLGQTRMSFCDDREDINSIALTAVSGLLHKYDIDPRSIGRLEVGTETMLDKSKSVKSVLMQLFEHCNTNIEGVDTINACYGGTNALFNAVNWVESRAWDGRDAIVVAGDIALYEKGNARPTGGAGCVAMLVGPNAVLALEPGLRGSYSRHAYDFYKPYFAVEYPYVDGHLSLNCYTEAVDGCYKAYLERFETEGLGHAVGEAMQATTNGYTGLNGHKSQQILPADKFDYMCFHAPTCKLVTKSYARLFYRDFLSDPDNELFKAIPAEFRSVGYASSLNDKTIEKTFMTLSRERFKNRVEPSMYIPTQCGNMYCGSLYSGLCSLLGLVHSDQLQGKRIGMFSYGSGLASTMFSWRVVGSTENIRANLDLKKRLSERRVVSPEAYDEACRLRAFAHQQSPYQPIGSLTGLSKDTYYLTHVDKMFRRTYGVK
ncbi:hydroxymethylglutaryl-coenzyme A synthase C terminal-domain-containing protein [Aspergillus caelatus]|uniref:Hydroxymethylglutaryl-CoA synthase n=2 Tax=Aspergillus subgen. Circumdati TaxID=2720871 RepID=A0A5N7A6M6_9EURO|nr:hydroxymethylglutaryl-coenzyme A synthase C terminal-domain-containing protein [Aspergillus caelatus]KAE8365517.1 hydroxymethylglutaryl-coenzyme A synthase C terminal-domain-containing protein [Aspergillus caelatus]KAE8421068.1 hydroxymethylglutaryl-coenzyme A synthase C terminal-domain-containing protein [Aspergillus pseudocaelatus]